MSRMRMMPENGTTSRCLPIGKLRLAPRLHDHQYVILPQPLELIVLLGEQHVEAGQRSVAARDVSLQLDLEILRQLGGVELLLERAQAVAQHHDLVEEGLDRPGLLLQLRVRRPQRQRPAAPFLGRHHGCDAALLADDAAQQHLDVDLAVVRLQCHRWTNPFPFADDWQDVALAFRAAPVAAPRGGRRARRRAACRRSRCVDRRGSCVRCRSSRRPRAAAGLRCRTAITVCIRSILHARQ